MEYNIPTKHRRLTGGSSRNHAGDKSDKCNHMLPETLNCPCWNTILSYLLLTDLVKLAQSHDSFAKIVDNFICSGYEITIDDVFIRRFPIQSNHNQYRRLGEKTRSLIVSGITQLEVNSLLPFFHDITQLTLEKVKLIEEETSEFPTGISSLKIAHSSIDDSFLRAWLAKTSLESLNLDNLQLTPCDLWQNTEEENPRRLAEVLKTVRHLTLQRIDMRWGWFVEHLSELESLTMIHLIDVSGPRLHLPKNAEKLRSLKVVANHCGSCNSYPMAQLFSLQHLSVRGREPAEVWSNVKMGGKLQSFECFDAPSSISEIRNWISLQDVKIHCNWYHADELRKTFSQAKSCIVTCSAPTPGSNFVDVLNDDCLHLILAYLDERDIYKLAIVHPRFFTLRPVIRIDKDCLNLYPPESCGAFYDALANYTMELEVAGLKHKEFFKVMRYFKRLSWLTLSDLQVDDSLLDVNEVSAFPMVDELHMYLQFMQSLSSVVWVALFRHLNPELKRLLVGGSRQKLKASRDPTAELTNIESLSIQVEESTVRLSQFFGRNKKLSFLDIQGDDMHQLLMEVHAPALRTLVFRGYLNHDCGFYSYAFFISVMNRFENLEWLNFEDCYLTKRSINTFDQLKYLNRLSVSRVEGPQLIPDILHKFPKLKILEVKNDPRKIPQEFLRQTEVFVKEMGKSFSYKNGEKFKHTFMFSDDAEDLLKVRYVKGNGKY